MRWKPFTKASKLSITLRQYSRTASNNIQKLSKQENANNALNNLKMAIPIITKDKLFVETISLLLNIRIMNILIVQYLI